MVKESEFDISGIRREYTGGSLRRKDLPPDPLELFEQWLKEACDAGLKDPTAMCVATVDEKGHPFQRIVLLKHHNDKGLVFYTNLNSRKAQQLVHNPSISLLFPWQALDQQVIFLGNAAQLPRDEVREYFRSRPKESQISACVSQQSSPISSRDVLEKNFCALQEQFQQSEVPLPDCWGGFRVRFHSVEFWQGGKHRLHDRFLYHRDENKNEWKICRLAP